MLEITATKKAPQAIGPYSQAISANGIIYTSGQIGLTPSGELVQGIEAQTRQVLENLSEVLKASNSGLSQVIKTTIFLSDMEHFGIVNGIYAEFFGDHKPARSTVAVKTLPKDALVEIECIALQN
ncbi:RidA family protein [Helicobacter canadensis]|uniref:Translation initiation inhibitor n=1 Tax=Helicobacter canadensis MIT 98-5491 TaxID=537970 RepID=C5ZWQ5_9HELI|nr:RidA family protein [Helicobacter canadensis]EES89573.1 translation initiation inhibitor [Helicobacter canadensis MIT 98-5491]EFR48364.1 putative endoribonuclease L-PSP [Helicobacter canadensis MIT 98-5491]STO99610.1 translation initiation inhibitor [Helicobacter canadensis]